MVVPCPPGVALDPCPISDRVVCWGRVVGLGVLFGLEVVIARQGVVVDVVVDVVEVVVLVSCEGVLEHVVGSAAVGLVANEPTPGVGGVDS
eukprot:2029104-Rhodomonas_salina.1